MNMDRLLGLNDGYEKSKSKIVVIMGPTGSGKSKLAIDLASHFPIEIINADSMQVYLGLDVLTNKVPLNEQKGVPHHLLGNVSPNVEFTAKHFRDSAIPLINDILSRNRLPVIVGGTNYYIQALVSPFLLDDSTDDMDEKFPSLPSDKELLHMHAIDEQPRLEPGFNYEHLKTIDPIAANRIHPNNHRKINQYLSLYARTGVLPSKVYQGKAAENWGQIHNSRFSCCFICMDAALPVLDHFVDQRVDLMVDDGLLEEVYDIYTMNADYTRGLRQAIGVREFENFLGVYLSDANDDKTCDPSNGSLLQVKLRESNKIVKEQIRIVLNSSSNDQLVVLLKEAIEQVKLNTRRLVRRQKRRVQRLETLYGWDIHYVDATESISSRSYESWEAQVLEPAVDIIMCFLNEGASSMPDVEVRDGTGVNLVRRDLWTQYICQACGDKVLRGDHEWEQHKQGRGHRKRISRLKKSHGFLKVLESVGTLSQVDI